MLNPLDDTKAAIQDRVLRLQTELNAVPPTLKAILDYYSLPAEGLVRLWQIIGNKKRGIPAVVPYGRSTWIAGVNSGRFPQPVRLGERTLAWRVEDIRELMTKLSRGEQV